MGGSASGFHDVLIGFGRGPRTVADGSAAIGGDLAGDGEGSLSIGWAVSDGSASGRLRVAGDVTGFGGPAPFRIGESGVPVFEIAICPCGAETAAGELYVGGDLIDGDLIDPFLAAPALRIGAAFTGTASGTATVEGTLEYLTVQVGYAEQGDANGLLRAGEISTRSMRVGEAVSVFGSTGGGRAVGEVRVTGDVGASSAGQLFLTVGSASAAASAAGELHVGGWLHASPPGSSTPGGVTIGSGSGCVEGLLEVEGISGVLRLTVGSSSGGEATGSALVRSGGVQGPGSRRSRLSVGTASNDGSATGVADLTGDVGGFTEFHVGRLGTGGTGSADGTLILRQGTATGGSMEVGANLGTGTASGRLHLDRSLVVLDDDIVLGEGSHLRIEVCGLERGSLYGAIDASLATLDGLLEVDFREVPQAGIYDLFVSGSEDGISGDFDSVLVAGVDPSLVSFGIEIAPLEGGSVEVYRLHLVPEPATALLLGLGLGALARLRRPSRGGLAASATPL